MFLLWIGDRISMSGIGNGISIIIFAGIVARMPAQFSSTLQQLLGDAQGSAVFCGALVSIDDFSNKAVSIERIQIRPENE